MIFMSSFTVPSTRPRCTFWWAFACLVDGAPWNTVPTIKCTSKDTGNKSKVVCVPIWRDNGIEKFPRIFNQSCDDTTTTTTTTTMNGQQPHDDCDRARDHVRDVGFAHPMVREHRVDANDRAACANGKCPWWLLSNKQVLEFVDNQTSPNLSRVR
mmetsp:Transcript_16980/g.39171  ORF Transcript_16980/g.39171 Transcript_16980/m.39171 type:complete len:155 (-) Transcript_16980:51-515(-)